MSKEEKGLFLPYLALSPLGLINTLYQIPLRE